MGAERNKKQGEKVSSAASLGAERKGLAILLDDQPSMAGRTVHIPVVNSNQEELFQPKQDVDLQRTMAIVLDMAADHQGTSSSISFVKDSKIDFPALGSYIKGRLNRLPLNFGDPCTMYSSECPLGWKSGPIVVQLQKSSASGNVQIDSLGLQIESLSNFSSARATTSVHRGRWMYEVTLSTPGIQQIGWATLQCPFTSEEGVGDAPDSYAYDGKRMKKWSGKSLAYGQPWVADDIIGCCIDLEACEVSFFRNGIPLGVAFSGVKLVEPAFGYYPAISLSHGERSEFNFGAQPFRYPIKSFWPLQSPPPVHPDFKTPYPELVREEGSNLGQGSSLVGPTRSPVAGAVQRCQFLLGCLKRLLASRKECASLVIYPGEQLGRPAPLEEEMVVMTAATVCEFLGPLLLAGPQPAAALGSARRPARGCYVAWAALAPFLLDLHGRASLHDGDSVEELMELLLLCLERHEVEACVLAIMDFLAHRARTSGYLAEDFPCAGPYPYLALVCRLLHQQEIMAIWVASDRFNSNMEGLMARKQPNREDLEALLPVVWWGDCREDQGSDVRMKHATQALSAAIAKVEELKLEIFKRLLVYVPPIPVPSAGSFPPAVLANPQPCALMCFLRSLIQRNRGATRNMPPPGLSNNTVLVSCYFAILALLHQGLQLSPHCINSLGYLEGGETMADQVDLQVGATPFLHRKGKLQFPASLFFRLEPYYIDLPRLGGTYSHLSKVFPVGFPADHSPVTWDESSPADTEAPPPANEEAVSVPLKTDAVPAPGNRSSSQSSTEELSRSSRRGIQEGRSTGHLSAVPLSSLMFDSRSQLSASSAVTSSSGGSSTDMDVDGSPPAVLANRRQVEEVHGHLGALAAELDLPRSNGSGSGRVQMVERTFRVVSDLFTEAGGVGNLPGPSENGNAQSSSPSMNLRQLPRSTSLVSRGSSSPNINFPPPPLPNLLYPFSRPSFTPFRFFLAPGRGEYASSSSMGSVRERLKRSMGHAAGDLGEDSMPSTSECGRSGTSERVAGLPRGSRNRSRAAMARMEQGNVGFSEEELLEILLLLYHLGVSHNFKQASCCTQSQMHCIGQLHETDRQIQSIGDRTSELAKKFREARASYRADVIESVRQCTWHKVALCAKWKQEAMYGTCRYTVQLLLAASRRGHLFSYLPEFYLETLLDSFHALRRCDPPEELLQQGLPYLVSFLVTHFSDPRIVNPDMRDQLLQSISVLLQYRDYMVVFEESLAARAALVPSLLGAFDARFWIPVSHILLRLCSGAGFGATRVAGSPMGSSSVFQALLQKKCEEAPELFASFLNRLFNTLNWTITEFSVAIKDMQDLVDQRQTSDLQQRKCGIMFELSCNLERLLEFFTLRLPHVFLEGTWGGGSGNLHLSRTCELMLFVLHHTTSGPDARLFDRLSRIHVLPLEKINRAMILAPLVGIALNLTSGSMAAKGTLAGFEPQHDIVSALCQADTSPMCTESFVYLLNYNWADVFKGDPFLDRLPELSHFVERLIAESKACQLAQAQLTVQDAATISKGRGTCEAGKDETQDEDEEDNLCSICCGGQLDTQFLPCLHHSCRRCIVRHLLNNQRCFFCNAAVADLIPAVITSIKPTIQSVSDT